MNKTHDNIIKNTNLNNTINESLIKKLKKDLEKIFELNKKNIRKKNDNLIKFITNPALIAEAYDNSKPNII